MVEKGCKMALVVSRFNAQVTERLLASAQARWSALGGTDDALSVVHVPGAVEIPLTAELCARSGQFDAIIALGAVIRGETDHYTWVCQQVSQGCQQVALRHALPVIFGVLTTETTTQAYARAGGKHSDKGSDSIDAALEMIDVVRAIADSKRDTVTA